MIETLRHGAFNNSQIAVYIDIGLGALSLGMKHHLPYNLAIR